MSLRVIVALYHTAVFACGRRTPPFKFVKAAPLFNRASPVAARLGMSRSVSRQPCGYWCSNSPAYRIHIAYLQAQRKFSCLFNSNAAPFLANFGRDCVCFVLFGWIILFALLSLAPTRDRRSMVPRACPQGAVPRSGAVPAGRVYKEGMTAAAWHPARGLPQAGCASGSFPQNRSADR